MYAVANNIQITNYSDGTAVQVIKQEV